LFRVGIYICVGASQSLFRVDSGCIWDWFVVGLGVIYLGLVQGFFRVGLEVILGWFKAYVGLVSSVFKVGLEIYFWLVQGWFRIYVGLVCSLFGFA